MEKNSEFESNIERPNKRFVHEFGSHAVVFDYLNTILYEHGENFEAFDHIMRLRDNEEKVDILFRDQCSELYDELYKEDFPRIFAPYPTENDERIWLNTQDRRLREALEAFEAESDE